MTSNSQSPPTPGLALSGQECEPNAGELDSSASGELDSVAFGQAMRFARPEYASNSYLAPGTRLAGGRILVNRRIGGGAMGTVYEAIDDGRPVAIKVLNRIYEHDIYRLKTEFRTLRELLHPNVVSVFELFQESSTWFFTMERIEGVPLHRFIEERRLQDLEIDDLDAQLADLQTAFLQLVQGVAAVHAAGLVHRDLKPTNVLVSNDQRVVIIDFGLVSESFAGGIGQTVDNRVSGTFGYMAPEQTRGETATTASDCYALGAILRQLLPASRGGSEVAAPLVSARAQASLGQLSDLARQLLSTRPSLRPSAQALLRLCEQWYPGAAETAFRGTQASQTDCLVGRENELECLRDAMRNAQRGGSPYAVIHGPCGIGKSHLVKRFVAELSNEGVTVLESRCSEWESVPYNGLDGVVDRLCRLLLRLAPQDANYFVPRHVEAVLRLFPTLRRVPAFQQSAAAIGVESDEPFVLRRRALIGLRDLFYRLAERRKVVILIEDLQWADLNTLQLLSELLATQEGPRLLLLVTLRAERAATQNLLGETILATNPTCIELGPLAVDTATRLASSLLPSQFADGPLIQQIVTESQGIPEFIVEFAHELSLAQGDRAPTEFSHALLARIERLAPPARQLLELVATAVRPITLRMASHCGIDELHASLRHLMNAHLVRTVALPSGERAVDTYTDHLRKVVIHAMPDARHVAYHSSLVKVLEGLPDVEPEWLLTHYRGAGSHARAREYSIIVAEKSLRLLAYDHAAKLFIAALELTPEHSEEWCELSIRCADALTMAGRGAEAAEVYARAARLKPRDEQLPLLNQSVEQWIRSGHLDPGVQLLRQTLDAVGIEWPETTTKAILQIVSRRIAIRLQGLSCRLRTEAETPPELLRKLDALRPAQTVLGTFDYIRGAAFSMLALPLALKAREPKRLLVALASEAVYQAMLDGTRGAQRIEVIQRQMRGLVVYAESPRERAVPTMVDSMCAYWSGNWPSVTTLALKGEAQLRENLAGTLWEASLLRSIRHTVLLHGGQFAMLESDLPEALDLAAVYDDRYTTLDLLRRQSTLCLAKGDVSQARRIAVEIDAMRRKYGFPTMDHLLMSLVVAIELYCGDAARAQDELTTRWAACKKMGMHRFPLVRLMVIGMHADCILADHAGPQRSRARAIQRLARDASDVDLAWAKGLARSLQGAAKLLDSNPTAAAVDFANAAKEFTAFGLDMCATVASWRATQAIQPTTIARPSLQGVADPLRWSRLVHSLF